MQTITARAFAKINWTLRVLRRRDDGYHDIETVFQSISLHDTLAFRRARRTELTCSDRRIPVDARNLVLGAVERLRECASFGGVRIHLEKRIPAGGGLGGGSSDAAVTLVALDRMFDLGISAADLREIAMGLGSDVPFFLRGGTAYATGRGERVETLPDVPPIPLLLVLPNRSMSTREAYAALGRTNELRVPAAGSDAWRAVVGKGLLGDPSRLENDFEEPFFAKHPDLVQWKTALRELGASLAMLSGSGSTIFGAFESAELRDAATTALEGRVRVVPAETLPAPAATPFER